VSVSVIIVTEYMVFQNGTQQIGQIVFNNDMLYLIKNTDISVYRFRDGPLNHTLSGPE